MLLRSLSSGSQYVLQFYLANVSDLRPPRSQHAQAHLEVLNILLSDNPQHANIARYLVSHGFYSSLRQYLLRFVSLYS